MTAGDGRRGLADPADARAACGVGAVVDLNGDPSHGTVADALELLANMEHRGATGADPDTGDGAGVMVRRPDGFFRGVVDADLPEEYAVGTVFMPTGDDARRRLRDLFETHLADHGLTAVAWRDVPTDARGLGDTARAAEPDVRQVFVAREAEMDLDSFDRHLYVARRAVENAVAASDPPGGERFYVVSLDRKRVVYKGLLTAGQLPGYYPDLTDERFRSRFALVHARFSTNTLGAWHLAHPYRTVVHNGEFNTIQGNVNWMRAREDDLAHDAFGEDLETVRPVVDDPDQSDTASVDNALELLLQGGRELPHALRMLVPEAWRGDDSMAEDRRAFYDYHASLVEPWDGPALVVGTDGDQVAGVLDRNGLRPCRYDVTTDGRLLLASEAGALEVAPENLAERGRLRPGELFVVDTEAGRVVPDGAVFADLAADRYGEWVDERQRHLDDALAADPAAPAPDAVPAGPTAPGEDLRARQVAFGYSTDELEELLAPMATDGADPVGSMGDDTPLAALGDHDRPLFAYFKQLFAQVTNPPLDYIREELVTSLESRLGHQRNLLGESPAHAEQLLVDSPVLSDAETAALKGLDGPVRSATVDLTFDPGIDLRTAVERTRADAAAAIADGADVVVLSDRMLGPDRLAVPSLLATGAVHHHLVRTGQRNRAGLVVESGDPRTVHHLATLVGYGAGAVNPYLAYESVADLVAGPDGADPADAVAAYVDALEDGLLKTMAKMGISTVESYQGAQIFEAVGLSEDLVAEYFEGTRVRTDGVGLAELERDVRERHRRAFEASADVERVGEFEHRTGGVPHDWNPETVSTLQSAVRDGDYGAFGEYSTAVDEGNGGHRSLRGLLAFDDDRGSVPLAAVEPVESIVERFSTAAMSLGSLSPEAHENNAAAMTRTGGKANTGEGGEPPERFGTDRECEVKQVASGRFGVTSNYLANAEEVQIKMAQGSKPGEGGHLPGRKVNEMIAHVRYATPGVGLISPPPLHDIYSIEDLKQLIFDLKAASPDADVNVKLVSEDGIGTIAAGVAKANADAVHVSGHSGGTGASPKSSIKHAGLPWELGLAEAQQMLRQTGLRDRVRLSVDGGLKTGRDVAVAALLGAEEFVFGTASLVSSGCVMARQCHENTCPVGVATQKEHLRERFPGEPEHVVNYVTFVARELREYMAELGFESVDEMVGRVDALETRAVDHPRARYLDLSPVLADPGTGPRRKVREQSHDDVEAHHDRRLVAAATPALADGRSVQVTGRVRNDDRAVGALLSNRVSARHGEDGLPEGAVRVDLEGTAGQSFGAFLASGVDLHLVGGANDYVGKGLSGGRLVVEPDPAVPYDPADQVLLGNVALYGATDGELYAEGRAGERFAVRNSGAIAVVEGVGDHGCEYMTGGAVAVLGAVGRNFAAGMSGGVAYVYDPDDELAGRANTGMVTLVEDLDADDERLLRRLVENHEARTDSDRAAALLAEWPGELSAFTKVLPDAYARAVEEEGREDVRTDLPAPAAADPERPADGRVAGGDD